MAPKPLLPQRWIFRRWFQSGIMKRFCQLGNWSHCRRSVPRRFVYRRQLLSRKSVWIYVCTWSSFLSLNTLVGIFPLDLNSQWQCNVLGSPISSSNVEKNLTYTSLILYNSCFNNELYASLSSILNSTASRCIIQFVQIAFRASLLIYTWRPPWFLDVVSPCICIFQHSLSNAFRSSVYSYQLFETFSCSESFNIAGSRGWVWEKRHPVSQILFNAN